MMKKKAVKTGVKHRDNCHRKRCPHDESNPLCSVYIPGYVLELELQIREHEIQNRDYKGRKIFRKY